MKEIIPPRRTSGLFAYSNWDIVPVSLGVLHLAGLIGLFFAIPHLSWPSALAFCFLYSVSISWNLNSVAHNFIHNPYFRSASLNKAFSLVESLAIGFSQSFYDLVHRLHHVGNSDRKGADGSTIDYLSIYRHSTDDGPEGVWTYTFLSFFRDDPKELYQRLKARSPEAARWGLIELSCWAGMLAIGLGTNWRAILLLAPFYYLGNALSSLNGYYRHYGGNTEEPLAWGVSSYNWLYNLIWLNNGYHAEHHYQPRAHWTKMKHLHQDIKSEQERCGVRILSTAHALGFLDRSLPKLSDYAAQVARQRISGKSRKDRGVARATQPIQDYTLEGVANS